MQADDQRIDALETRVDAGFAKIDKGFAEIREELREMRQDIRQIQGQTTTWGVAILAMWLTMILGFAGIVVAMISQS